MVVMLNDFVNRRIMCSLNVEQEQEVVDVYNVVWFRVFGLNMMKMVS